MKKLTIILFLVLLSGCDLISFEEPLTITPLFQNDLNSYTCITYEDDGAIDYVYKVSDDTELITFDLKDFYFNNNRLALEVNNILYVTDTNSILDDYDPLDVSTCALPLFTQTFVSNFTQVEDTYEFIYTITEGGYWYKIITDELGNITNYYAYINATQMSAELYDINNTVVTFPTGEATTLQDIVMMFHTEYTYVINESNELVIDYFDWDIVITADHVDFIKDTDYFRYTPGSLYMENMNNGDRFTYYEIEEEIPTLTHDVIDIVRDITGDLIDIVNVEIPGASRF